MVRDRLLLVHDNILDAGANARLSFQVLPRDQECIEDAGHVELGTDKPALPYDF